MLRLATIATVLLAALLPGALAGYTHAMGQVYSYYAGAAYCTSTKLSSWACNKCESGFQVKQVVANSISNIQVFIGYRASSSEIIVSYRGTVAKSITNWVEDLDAKQVPVWTAACPGCAVHSGFWNSYQSVSSQVLSAVKSLRSAFPAAGLVLTGHSLGGSLAAITAIDFSISYGIKTSRVVTYGEPRVGNDAYAAFFQRTVPEAWRVTHNKDIVPHAPPAWMGFTHAPTEIFYATDSTYKICSGGEDSTCADQYSLFWQWSASDHLNYLGIPIGSAYCS